MGIITLISKDQKSIFSTLGGPRAPRPFLETVHKQPKLSTLNQDFKLLGPASKTVLVSTILNVSAGLSVKMLRQVFLVA